MAEKTVHYGVRPNLPAKPLIDRGILRLKEAGIMKKIHDKHVPKLTECAEFSNVGYKPVEMKYVFGAYGILVTGIVCALAVWAIEWAFSYKYKEKA